MSKFLERSIPCGLIAVALAFALGGAAEAQTSVCEDPSRTIFAGAPGSEGCLEITDQAICEAAWNEGRNGPASCFYAPGCQTNAVCCGCGPNNEDAGLCSNTCVAPPEPPEPEDGIPSPCTIGFWKNRSDTPMGQAQHFPDPEFDVVVDVAADLTPVFADGIELLDALVKKGRRTQQERAEQQLAALLLNLGGGYLPPDGQKCELFDGNAVSDNACEGATTVGESLEGILEDMAAGRFELAKDCADDINNGIGVADASMAD
jgi:hypothetical protein